MGIVPGTEAVALDFLFGFCEPASVFRVVWHEKEDQDSRHDCPDLIRFDRCIQGRRRMDLLT